MSCCCRSFTRWIGVLALVLGLPARATAEEKTPRPADGGPQLTAAAVLVLDNATGKTLLDRRADEVRSIASLTKLMAALVYMDRGLKLEAGTVVNRDDWRVALAGCRTRLELNWTYRNIDLLHAALMSSDNRAISALGRAVNLNANGLVQAMNERARRMGLKVTHYLGPAGIEEQNVSTAREMSRIVREASRNPVLRKIMGKQTHQVKPMRGYLKVVYGNTNPLLAEIKDATFHASKTGFNHRAGYCLATVVELHGRGSYTIVLLGSKHKGDRVRDLRHVLSWLRAGARPKSSSAAAKRRLVG